MALHFYTVNHSYARLTPLLNMTEGLVPFLNMLQSEAISRGQNFQKGFDECLGPREETQPSTPLVFMTADRAGPQTCGLQSGVPNAASIPW